MLSALLLTGLISTPLATVFLFVPPPWRGPALGVWPSARRFVLAVAATAVLVVAAAVALTAIGVTTRNLTAGLIGLVIASLAWLPVTRRWSARAHVCWAATTYLFVAYLAYMLWWTFNSGLGASGVAGGLVLWVLELAAAFLGCAYLWELCDALGREAWLRRIRVGATEAAPAEALPFVCLQVPAYNEPPDMVIETLRSLKAMDYPSFQIIVIDDNTDDEQLWRPVEAWCLEHEVTFAHLDDWPGYKSGALNYALRELVDERTELIGVIDADYQLDHDFLWRCAPLFDDPGIGFIQAPQDYRDWEQAPFYRRLYYSYRYFFAVTQPSRNERDGAIFAGTMGLIRRRALEQVGGWDEWCITEDAELSLRLLRAGWSGIHVDRSFGHGVMPLTFEALKGQRFRWCFGGIQILRRNWRTMLPWPRTKGNQLSLGQRWAYLSGALQWYGDLLALLFYAFLLVGAANVAFGGGLLFRKLSGFLLAAIPMLVLLGLLRAVALLRRGTGASWRDAFGAFMIWQSTALVVARASLQGLFAKEAEFLRTPKTAEEGHWWDAIRGNPGETVLALLGLAGLAGALTHVRDSGGLLSAILLLWPTIAFASAPLNSLSAQRAALPADLRQRRRSEYRRYGVRRVSFALGGLVTTVAAVAVAVALLTPGGTNLRSPNPIPPAQGHKNQPAQLAPTTPSTRTPSQSTTGASGSPTSASSSTSSSSSASSSASSSSSSSSTSSATSTATVSALPTGATTSAAAPAATSPGP